VQLFIADLYRSLEAASSRLPPDAARLLRALEEQLPAPAEAPFDLILAWDLLNYFEAAQLTALGGHLGRLCRPGGQLFALIATRGPICDRPLVFQILKHDLLLYEAPVATERPCPRYRETWLERQLEDFAVQTSFLLRNGMQEYVFTRRVGHAAMPPTRLRRF
jgi:SAM-dependent methyltransferase